MPRGWPQAHARAQRRRREQEDQVPTPARRKHGARRGRGPEDRPPDNDRGRSAQSRLPRPIKRLSRSARDRVSNQRMGPLSSRGRSCRFQLPNRSCTITATRVKIKPHDYPRKSAQDALPRSFPQNLLYRGQARPSRADDRAHRTREPDSSVGEPDCRIVLIERHRSASRAFDQAAKRGSKWNDWETLAGGGAFGSAVRKWRGEDLAASVPKELGVLLVVGGIGGLLLPGPVGSPFLILGGVILWPAAFKRVESCFEKRFPRLHRQGMSQIARFVSDFERRYPWTR